LSLGTRSQVIGIDLIKARVRQPQFAGGLQRGDLIPAMAGEEMADDGGGETFDQL